MMLCSCGTGVAYFCYIFRNWCPEIFMGSSRLSLLPFLTGISSYVWLTSVWFGLLLCWKIFMITTTLIIVLYLLFCLFCCREAAVSGRPGCWFLFLCNTWENSSFSASTGESNSLQSYGHLPEYITLLEGFEGFCLFVFTWDLALSYLNTLWKKLSVVWIHQPLIYTASRVSYLQGRGFQDLVGFLWR